MNAGLLRREQLDEALEKQRAQGPGGRRLGQVLVDLGVVGEVQLTKVLSQQLSVPWVSLQHIDFSRQLLGLVPRDVAEEFCLIPVYVRHERKVGDTLYLAMEDPTHDEAIRQVMAASGMPVKAMIAPPTDIRQAIRVYYLGERPPPIEDLRATMPIAVKGAPPGKPPPPPPMANRSTVEQPRGETTSPQPGPAAAGGEVKPRSGPVRPIKRPSRSTSGTGAVPQAARTLSLTLLDGTTIQIPSQRKGASADTAPPSLPIEDEPTTQDLIEALRAVAAGGDPNELLGGTRWEELIAALLAVLVRKQLVSDREFVDEWFKARGGS